MIDPYRPPKTVASPPRSRGEIVLAQQSLIGALVGGALGAFIGVAVWMMVVIISGENAGYFALIVALFTGVLVRFNGRGLTKRYRLIAALMTWVGVVAGVAWSEYPGIPIAAFFLAGGLAAVIAGRRLDLEDEKSLLRLRLGHPEK